MEWFKKKDRVCEWGEFGHAWVELAHKEYFEIKLKRMPNIIVCDGYQISYRFTDKGSENVYLLFIDGLFFATFYKSQIERMEKITKYDCCKCLKGSNQYERRVRII